MQVKARFLGIMRDYEPPEDHPDVMPFCVGIFPDSSTESILMEVQWNVERSDIPDAVTTESVLAAVSPLVTEALRAARNAAVAESDLLTAWFELDWRAAPAHLEERS